MRTEVSMLAWVALERLADLPPSEQRAVLKVVDGFLDTYSATNPRRPAPALRPKRKAS